MRRQLDIAHGCCTLVSTLDAARDAPLLGDELAHANTLADHRRSEFVMGRTALRLSLRRLAGATPDAGILSDARGAPILPAGWVGSISHKGDLAAGLVAPDAGMRIGVDLERAAPPRTDIGRRVLTAREQAAIAHLSGAEHGRAVTLRFSIKEAIYKAVDPFVRRYVGFTEVELEVGGDGSCRVHVLDRARLPLAISAAWIEDDGYWVTSAAAGPATLSAS